MDVGLFGFRRLVRLVTLLCWGYAAPPLVRTAHRALGTHFILAALVWYVTLRTPLSIELSTLGPRELPRFIGCRIVLTPFQPQFQSVMPPSPPILLFLVADPEWDPEPLRASSSRARPPPKRKRGPPAASCTACEGKFVPIQLCPPCQRNTDTFVTDRDKGYWESAEVLYSYLMAEVGNKVKPRAKLNVEVKIRPCSIDALTCLRRRFMQSRCPPGLTLKIAHVLPGRGATTSVLPKVWTLELTDWATCGAIFTPAWRRPGRAPGLHANGLVVLLPNGCAFAALPPFRFKLTSMCPLGRKQGRASMRFDSMILTDTGEWLPPQENFPNLECLMMGTSLDLLKIQKARMTSNSLGNDVPLLPAAMINAAFNTIPPEYWPYSRPVFSSPPP